MTRHLEGKKILTTKVPLLCYFHPVPQVDLPRVAKQQNRNVSHHKLWVSNVCGEISPVRVPEGNEIQENESPILSVTSSREVSLRHILKDPNLRDRYLSPKTELHRHTAPELPSAGSLHQAQVGTQWLHSRHRRPQSHPAKASSLFTEAGREVSAPRGLAINSNALDPKL